MKIEELNKLETSSRFRYFDWEKAKNFYYVSKFGSFTKAANFLRMSQPSLSRQVTCLEGNLGYPLFSRRSRGISLTRKGEELSLIIEDTFLKIKQFTNNHYVNIDNGKERKIKIASTNAISSYILGDLIADYNKKNPHIIFELVADDYLIDILLNDVDIAIRPIDERIKDTSNQKNVRQEYLFSLEKKLYASSEYLEKYGEPETVKDLKKHCLLSLNQPESHPFSDVNWILKLGMQGNQLNKPFFTSNSVECLINAAKNGMGIISSYEEYQIIKESNLINILPSVKCNEIKEYFIYPNYLAKDQEIMNIKNFMAKNLNANIKTI